MVLDFLSISINSLVSTILHVPHLISSVSEPTSCIVATVILKLFDINFMIDIVIVSTILMPVKTVVLVLCTLLTIHSVSAQTDQNDSFIDRIKQLDLSNLAAYADPLMTSLGVALGTGIFYSAYSHDVFEFDVGLRVMNVGIPASARYFTGTAVVCSLANGQLDCYDVEVENTSTIFGPGETTTVPTSGTAIAIPPVFPGGFDITSLPFAIPQVNIGLPFGFEIGLGYLPLALTFPLNREKNLYFLRLGGKLGINKFPFLRKVTLPCALAIGGFYQRARLKGEAGVGEVTMTLWNLQVLASRRLDTRSFFDVEPFVGAGIEGTKFNFQYDFEKVIPDTVGGLPTDSIAVIEDIDVNFYQQSRLRAIIGMTFYLGPVYLHYDYNIVTYKTHNIMLGVTVR